MKPVKKILTKLNGLHFSQEYLCFSKGSFSQPLHVYLVSNGLIVKDITAIHLFVGYNPLIFAFPADPALPPSLHIIFSQLPLQLNAKFSTKDAIASLDLTIIKNQVTGSGDILYYAGTRGNHHFLSAFHQFVNSLYNQWYNKKPGNVFLHDNLYKQVQVAYAVPRNISLITVGSNNLFNLFPTDLHGQVDEEHYIISLRIGGKACEQVEQAGKLLLSQVHADAYKMVYGLGKNHMQPLKPGVQFPFSHSLSENFKWPIPQQVISYRELKLLDSFNHGIHKILLFKIASQRQLQGGNDSLYHIHNSYASWRYKNNLPGNYLLR